MQLWIYHKTGWTVEGIVIIWEPKHSRPGQGVVKTGIGLILLISDTGHKDRSFETGLAGCCCPLWRIGH